MILEPNKDNILKAAEEIKRGNIVAFPTETVYGLGADCTNPIAVSKIFEAKQRPSFNPLIVHIHSFAQMNDIAYIEKDEINNLVEKFWPGPLTIVLPKKKVIPDIVTAGHATVAIRMPAHKVALELIEAAGTPISAPSANMFGFLSPTKPEHVQKQLGSKANIILNGGDSSVGVESTIIEFTDDGAKVLRPGGLAVEEIKKVIPNVIYNDKTTNTPNAPGMLLHHYAPSIQIKFIDEVEPESLNLSKVGALLFDGSNYNYDFIAKRMLSTSGNFNEAAANLFKYLHELENENIELIVVERVEPQGLGIAIMDRLTKAANRYR